MLHEVNLPEVMGLHSEKGPIQATSQVFYERGSIDQIFDIKRHISAKCDGLPEEKPLELSLEQFFANPLQWIDIPEKVIC